MNDYIAKCLAESKPTTSGVTGLDLDQLLSGLRYDNELRFVVNEYEFRKYHNLGVRASYTRRRDGDVHVDFFWGVRHTDTIPSCYPKDGIGKNGKAIWESCFCVTFLTPRSTERGKAKKIILPVFPHEAQQRCYVRSHMRATGATLKCAQSAFCSESQLEALVAILRRFEETGDEDGVEFAAMIPCEMVVQNG